METAMKEWEVYIVVQVSFIRNQFYEVCGQIDELRELIIRVGMQRCGNSQKNSSSQYEAGKRLNKGSSYCRTSLMRKVEFPKFEGEDVEGCLNHDEHFFSIMPRRKRLSSRSQTSIWKGRHFDGIRVLLRAKRTSVALVGMSTKMRFLLLSVVRLMRIPLLS